MIVKEKIVVLFSVKGKLMHPIISFYDLLRKRRDRSSFSDTHFEPAPDLLVETIFFKIRISLNKLVVKNQMDNAVFMSGW